MKPIIPSVAADLIECELTEGTFVKKTHVGDNEIHIVDAACAPHVMREIGRLREVTFRAAGGGTGQALDIDAYDTGNPPFQQLLVWSRKEHELVGAYRFIVSSTVPLDARGYPDTPTSKLFHFSDDFIQNQWKRCIELGRSFVQPKHQATTSRRRGLFALDNVWDGLGALICQYPEVDYFIGKMTLYANYDRTARQLILDFLEKHFQGDPGLVYPASPLSPTRDEGNHRNPFLLADNPPEEDFKLLNQEIRKLGERIPPLIKTYLSLSPTVKSFGIVSNGEFGNVEEICILIKISEIYEKKKARHVQPAKGADPNL